MCGIAGIINSVNTSNEKILKMCHVMRHRGPDDEGYVLIDKNNRPHHYNGYSDAGNS
jgi:asparagine synthetase B (glutamine-hydrolysing)